LQHIKEMKLVPNSTWHWEFIRKLRNDPDIQKYLIEQVNITPEQQFEYMSKYNDCYYICVAHELPIGYIGIKDNEIGLVVLPAIRRHGAGKFMLTKMRKLHPKCYARIKPDNIASIKLFESCGFIFKRVEKGVLIYE